MGLEFWKTSGQRCKTIASHKGAMKRMQEDEKVWGDWNESVRLSQATGVKGRTLWQKH